MEYDKEGHLCNDCNQDQVAHTLNQTLWPDHCIMETSGASLAANLKTSDSDIIIRKGSNCEVSKSSVSDFPIPFFFLDMPIYVAKISFFFRENVVVITFSELRPGSNERHENSTFYGPFRFLIFILTFDKKQFYK